jgi:hypothetical protein
MNDSQVLGVLNGTLGMLRQNPEAVSGTLQGAFVSFFVAREWLARSTGRFATRTHGS